MGRRGGHSSRGAKRPRTLARDFRAGPREDVWQPGTGSERVRPGADGQQGGGQQQAAAPGGDWTITAEDMVNEGFEAYYKARAPARQSEGAARHSSLRRRRRRRRRLLLPTVYRLLVLA